MASRSSLPSALLVLALTGCGTTVLAHQELYGDRTEPVTPSGS